MTESNTTLTDRFETLTEEQQNALLAEMDSVSFDGLSEQEIDAHMTHWFGDGFTDATKDIFERAVLTVTETVQEELASAYQDRINELERELVFRECCQGMALTERERFRNQVEHIRFDDVDSFKTQLLSEKRRRFPCPSNYDPLKEEYYDPPESKPDPLQEAAMKVLADMSRWNR